MNPTSSDLSLQVQTACVLEASARKLGNVHPLASFPDLCYADFVDAAEAVAPLLARSRELGVGRAVLEAMEATRARTGKNVNLGIILLIAPLAAVPPDVPLREGIGTVLARLTNDDARLVYQAIRLAQPGGLGRVEREDVSSEPTGTLLDVMSLAAGRDLIAAQFATGFSLVLDDGASFIGSSGGDFPLRWEEIIIGLQLELLSKHLDSLIARKRGAAAATEASRRASACQTSLSPLQGERGPGGEGRDLHGCNRKHASVPAAPHLQPLSLWGGEGSVADFDAWLRADGHRRNPGTTADLIAASLFAAFRDGIVPMPSLDDIQNEVRSWETSATTSA